MDLALSRWGLAAGALALGIAYFMFSKNKKRSPDSWQSHVLPHSPLERLADNLYIVRGTLKAGPPRNMAIYVFQEQNTNSSPSSPRKRSSASPSSSSLLIHSCVAVNEETLAQILTLGEPKILLVPNSMHRIDAAVWKARFPSLLVVCPRKAERKVCEVVPVDAHCEDVLPRFGIRVIVPQGVKADELVYELTTHHTTEKRGTHTSKALLFCDMLFNFGPNSGLIQRMLGSCGDGVTPKITPLFKWMGVENKQMFKKWFTEEVAEGVSEEETEAVLVVAHGEPVKGNVRRKLLSAIQAC